MRDSRGFVAALRQNPQQELGLLVGLRCGRDDDVATRSERPAQDHLPTRGVLMLQDRVEHTQVVR